MSINDNTKRNDAQYNQWVAGRLQRDLNEQRYRSELSQRADAVRQNRLIRELIHKMKIYLLVAPVLVFLDITPLFFWDSSKTGTEIANDPTPLTTFHETVTVVWFLAFIVSFFVFSIINGYLISYPILRKKLRRIAGEADWKNPETRIGFAWKMYMVIIGICSVLYLIVALVPL